MANYYPTGYQPAQIYYPQNSYVPQQTQVQQPQPQNNNLIWVQGESGAKSYLVAPNSSVVLWDSESPSIYVKSADASGLPRIRIFDYVERTDDRKPEAVNMDFAPISDFEQLKCDVEEIKKYLKESEKGKEKVK